jgi:hypothetical protein
MHAPYVGSLVTRFSQRLLAEPSASPRNGAKINCHRRAEALRSSRAGWVRGAGECCQSYSSGPQSGVVGCDAPEVIVVCNRL